MLFWPWTATEKILLSVTILANKTGALPHVGSIILSIKESQGAINCTGYSTLYILLHYGESTIE